MAYIEEANELMTDATGQSIATAIGNMSATSVGNLAALQTTDKTSLVGAVNEVKSGLTNVNSKLTAHTLGNGIAVTNGFTAPSDGYIIVSKGNNTNTAALQLTVGTTTVYPIVLTSATSSSSLFVHEGFTIDRYSADADATFTFYPLV